VLASRLKRTRVGDRLARRNPAYYGRALRLFDRLEESDPESRRRFTEKRLRVALAAARRTRYGAAAGGGTSLDDWPLLDKDAVRDDPEAFGSAASPPLPRARAARPARRSPSSARRSRSRSSRRRSTGSRCGTESTFAPPASPFCGVTTSAHRRPAASTGATTSAAAAVCSSRTT
jgi:hypothetical protein